VLLDHAFAIGGELSVRHLRPFRFDCQRPAETVSFVIAEMIS
jgi:hypothetical protein